MSEAIGCDLIKQSLADIAAGKQVVVVDHEDRENESDLVFATRRLRRSRCRWWCVR